MKHYELLFLTRVALDDKNQEAIVNKVINSITQAGGSISKQEDWGKRKLAYLIDHEQHGWYMLIEFDLAGTALKKIETELRLTPEILRYLMVQKAIKTEEELAKERKIQERIKAREFPKEPEKMKEEIVPEKKGEVKEKKISLEDLDKKLDEILEEDI